MFFNSENRHISRWYRDAGINVRSWQGIRRFLSRWTLNGYVDIFEAFIEHGFEDNLLGKLSSLEKNQMLNYIGKIRRNEELSYSDIPDLQDEITQERIRNWLINVTRLDKCINPSNGRSLLSINVFADNRTIEGLRLVYGIYGERLLGSREAGEERVNKIQEGKLHLLIGETCLVSKDTVLMEDLSIMPDHAYESAFERLGVIIFVNRPFVVVSKHILMDEALNLWLGHTPLLSSKDFDNDLGYVVTTCKANQLRVHEMWNPLFQHSQL